MNDKSIIMSGWSVRAILAGTKTQTRRPIKLPGYDWQDGPPGLMQYVWLAVAWVLLCAGWWLGTLR